MKYQCPCGVYYYHIPPEKCGACGELVSKFLIVKSVYGTSTDPEEWLNTVRR